MLKNTRNRINARLKMLYDMMPECDCMGDVGTDHGFLPIYCVINGKCKSAVASDLREGPLKIAQKNILLHHCEKQIQTRLCSGLKEYRAQECDVVVIAGMGGFTICNILAEWLDQSAQEKYFPGNILFLLQPNTAEQELREFLWEHFFQIQDECAVQDGSHVYAGIKGHFTKEKELYTKVECYTGKVMCRRLAENGVIYYKALYQKYRNVLAGLTAKREPDEECLQNIEFYRHLLVEIERMINRRC